MFRGVTIQTNENPINVTFKKVNEIFKFGDKPYLCVAKSGAGKTTLCLDIMHKYASEASKIYYVSATQNNLNEDSLSQIPEVFRRPPTFDAINRIWEEITQSGDAFNRDTDGLLRLIGKIYPSNEVDTINKYLEEEESSIRSEYSITRDSSNKTMSTTELRDSILAWKVEVLTRLLLSGVDKYGTQKSSITDEDMDTLSSLMTDKQRTLLFIDDVSSELIKMKTSKNHVYYKGNPTPEGQAYQALLTDIMTRARHTESIVIIFVHTWNTIDVKNTLDNFIVLDANSAGAVRSYRSLPDKVKTVIPQVSSMLFNDYPYHFIVSRNSGNDVCVSKADLHEESLDEEVDDLNKRLIRVFDDIRHNKTVNEHSNEDSNEHSIGDSNEDFNEHSNEDLNETLMSPY